MLKTKHLVSIILVFFILIGSDILIGAVGHYSGSTQGSEAYTFGAFLDYLQEIELIDFVIILSAAILVFLIVYKMGVGG